MNISELLQKCMTVIISKCKSVSFIIVFVRRRLHPSSHRSSSFTLLQSLAIEDSKDKPTYSVLLCQLFAFIGTSPDQAVSVILLSGIIHCVPYMCVNDERH